MLDFAMASKKPRGSRKKRPSRHETTERPSRDPYGERGAEPDLRDLINDPVTKALMAKDGVSPTSLDDLISSTRHYLRERKVA
jgi:hypothetical protein